MLARRPDRRAQAALASSAVSSPPASSSSSSSPPHTPPARSRAPVRTPRGQLTAITVTSPVDSFSTDRRRSAVDGAAAQGDNSVSLRVCWHTRRTECRHDERRSVGPDRGTPAASAASTVRSDPTSRPRRAAPLRRRERQARARPRLRRRRERGRVRAPGRARRSRLDHVRAPTARAPAGRSRRGPRRVASSDAADLAFLRADSIDVALAAGLLGEVEDIDRLFRQVHRVLRPGAPFVFSYEHPIALAIAVTPRAWRAPARPARGAPLLLRARPVAVDARGRGDRAVPAHDCATCSRRCTAPATASTCCSNPSRCVRRPRPVDPVADHLARPQRRRLTIRPPASIGPKYPGLRRFVASATTAREHARARLPARPREPKGHAPPHSLERKSVRATGARCRCSRAQQRTTRWPRSPAPASRRRGTETARSASSPALPTTASRTRSSAMSTSRRDGSQAVRFV